VDELEVVLYLNNPGVYNYYGASYKLEPSKQNAVYRVVAKFLDNRETKPNSSKYYKIFWEIPKSATMIKTTN
jgi:hypothetical protein